MGDVVVTVDLFDIIGIVIIGVFIFFSLVINISLSLGIPKVTLAPP